MSLYEIFWTACDHVKADPVGCITQSKMRAIRIETYQARRCLKMLVLKEGASSLALAVTYI